MRVGKLLRSGRDTFGDCRCAYWGLRGWADCFLGGEGLCDSMIYGS